MATLEQPRPGHSDRATASEVRRTLILISLLVLAVTTLVWWVLRLPVGSSLTHDTINEASVGAERAVVEVGLGAGHLQLGAGSTDQMLEGHVQTLTGIETFTRTATAENGAMVYRLLSDAPNTIREPERWPEWTLKVTPELPLELSVRGGMGASTLDLSKLKVRKVVLEPRAARYTVTFPEGGQVDAVVEGGTSRTTLITPAGIALKAVLNVQGAGHIELDGQVYRRDTTYTSPNYAAADNHLNLVVTSNLAHIVIEQR